MDDDVEKSVYAQTAQGMQNVSTSALGSISIEREEVIRENRVQSAIYHLTEARRIRSDPALMAEVTAWLHDKRNEFMMLLDDLEL